MEVIGMKQSKPIIGIMPTFNLTNPSNEPHEDRASFVRLYVDKISSCGGIPIGLLEENVSDYLDICDAFLWPGGTKIWPSFYKVIEHSLKTHKPILGVCMGAQAIANYFNMLDDQKRMPDKSLSEVYDLMREENPYLLKMSDDQASIHKHFLTKDKESIDKARHEIEINEKSKLYEILGTKTKNVVSIHRLCINRLPGDIVLSAKSKDGVIEGIEYFIDNNHIIGVQYHPELDDDKKIFKWLVDTALEVKNARDSRS